jgi:hypothetical protein
MSGWAHRIRRPAVPLQEVQAAAQNLANQAGLCPGKARVVFQTVADVALLGTVLVSGALATVHLFKALFPQHKEHPPSTQPAGGGREPTRRRGPGATAPDHVGYEDDGPRSR